MGDMVMSMKTTRRWCRCEQYRNVQNLHAVPTQLDGEFAYPMFARGQMIGVMVLGPKLSGESHAPDEAGAIEQIASTIASTLDAIALGESRRNDALLEGLLSIQESLAAF